MQPFMKIEWGLGVKEEDYAKIPFKFIGFGSNMSMDLSIYDNFWSTDLV